MPYYVYIILCEGDTLYTGYTKNVDSRVRLHKRGKAARYTRIHKPKELIHIEEFDSIAKAMKREKRIKKLTHQQKLKLANFKTKMPKRKKLLNVPKMQNNRIRRLTRISRAALYLNAYEALWKSMEVRLDGKERHEVQVRSARCFLRRLLQACCREQCQSASLQFTRL